MTVPLLGERRPQLSGDLAVSLVTLVADKHDGNVLNVPFDINDLLKDGLEFLERLAAAQREDEDEGVALGDGESLHSGELMGARRVRDLQGTHLLVTADHLAVRVLDGRDVRLLWKQTQRVKNHTRSMCVRRV